MTENELHRRRLISAKESEERGGPFVTVMT